MTTIAWGSGVSGAWSTAADWAGGKVPGSTNDVSIAAFGAYTVSLSSSASVHSLALDSFAAALDITAPLAIATGLSITQGKLELGDGGVISGGTVSYGGGSFLAEGGTLSGVIFKGPLNLSASYASLTITDGITLAPLTGTGAGTVNITGQGASMFLTGSTTLNNATVNLGNANANYTETLGSSDPNSIGGVTLTLGSKLILNQAGGATELQAGGNASDAIVNAGTINAGYAGGRLTVDSLYSEDNETFTNQSRINVNNTDSFVVDAGTFTNAGTVTINDGFATIDANTVGTGSILGSPAISVLFRLVRRRWMGETMDSHPWCLPRAVSLAIHGTRLARNQPCAADN